MRWMVSLIAYASVCFGAAQAQVIGPGRPVGDSAWRLDVQKDPMTDLGRASAFVMSDDGLSALIVQCQAARRDSRVYVAIESQNYVGGTGRRIREVLVRLDQSAPQRMFWSHDQDTATLLDQRQVAALVSQLKPANRFAFRGWTEEGDRNVPIFEATFAVAGAGAAMDALYAACGLAPPA